jgi:uncharacterized glyoxalase superfamily protein PhnB
MAKITLNEQLDRAVDALLASQDSSLPRASAKIAPLVRVARELRGLPDEDFRTRLKTELQRRAEMASTAVKHIREGFHSVTPYIIIPGAAGFIDFLKGAFGATERFRVAKPGSDLIMHAEVTIGDCIVELADATPEFPPLPGAIHLYVPNVDAVHAQAVKAGGISKHDPADQEYGERGSFVKDAFGNHWYLGTPLGDEPAPEGLRAVTPYFQPRDAGKMIEFLKQAFQAETIERFDAPDGTVLHAKMRIGDSIVEMSDAHGEYQPMPMTMHVYVPDTDKVYARALSAGATSLREPRDEPYGDRNSGVQDPFGNRWFIATHIKDVAF